VTYKVLKFPPNEPNIDPIDIFSLGHLLFGITVASIYFAIQEWSALVVPTNIYLIFVLITSNIIFLGWEGLEHTVIKKYIYRKLDPDWRESKINSFTDVIFGFAGCAFYYAFAMIYPSYPIFVVVLPWLTHPFVAFLVLKIGRR